MSAEPAPARFVIRHADLGDLDALHALEHAAFAGDRAERRAIRHAIRAPSISVLVAIGGGDALLGAATVERRRGARRARLTSIATAPGQGGSGLGRALLAAAEAEAVAHGADALRLEVRADNAAGIRLYERAGYQRFAVVADYYDDGMAAWRYERALTPP
jgi:[ribosomal protein S18]-alanine N-acetyltransferase